MSDLVGNPEDRFSHNEAHFLAGHAMIVLNSGFLKPWVINNYESSSYFSLQYAYYTNKIKVEDIYMAAGWESMYQNGYLHGSPSIFSAKSAIYTASGCQHKIAIYTAALREPFQLCTRLPCVHIKSLFTRQPFKSQIGYIHYCRVYTRKSLFKRQPLKSQMLYIYLTAKET